MKSNKNTIYSYPVMYFTLQSELFMKDGNLLHGLTCVTNIEETGLMAVL